MIPQAAPALRIARYRAEIHAAVSEVMGGQNYILGPKVEAFEAAFAASLNVRHCVGVNSGTDALTLALRALGIGHGDEVITVSMTMAATAQAILLAGAVPCFVDVDAATWLMDLAAAEAAITPRTRAILVVHLYGNPAPVLALRALADRSGLALIEDCAQSHGARIPAGALGSFGDAAAFSFYPTKNLGAIGDGGAIVTNDRDVAARLRSLRAYGWGPNDRISRAVSANSRLDELQAAILLVMLRHLEEGNTERREIAAYYEQRFAGSTVKLAQIEPGSVFHQFTVTVPRRDAVMAELEQRFGIRTAIHYTPPLHQQPAFSRYATIPLPTTERLARELVSLPIQPEVAGPNRKIIADALLEVVGHG